MNILFIGDIVARLGRTTVRKVLPPLRRDAKIGLVIANGENLAHGRGVTASTVADVFSSQVDCLTSGNHVFWQKESAEVVADTDNLIRPANYPDDTPGEGFTIIDTGKEGRVLIINLLGRGFMGNAVACPFRTADRILDAHAQEDFAAILVDFHAEATSEKVALGWYLDGRVTAVVGTHTHVPTADAWILPQGTAYVTDAGMVGAHFSVLGVESEIIVAAQKDPLPQRFEWVEEGPAVFQSVLIKVGKNGKALDIERIDRSLG